MTQERSCEIRADMMMDRKKAPRLGLYSRGTSEAGIVVHASRKARNGDGKRTRWGENKGRTKVK